MTDKTSIETLMASDPTGHTDQDIDLIIAELRKQRGAFINEGDKKVGTPVQRKSKAQKTKEETKEMMSKMDISSILDGI